MTHNISDLLQRYLILYKSGKKFECKGDFKCIHPREIGHRTYGRCFEIKLTLDQDTIFSVDIQIKKSIYIFFNLPSVRRSQATRHVFKKIEKYDKTRARAQE